MKIIFLDVDGVLNAPKRYLQSLKVNSNEEIHKIFELDRNKVIQSFYFNIEYYDNLARICKETDAKIVMSSSWKSYFEKNDYDIMVTKSMIETNKAFKNSYKHNKEKFPWFNQDAFILLVLFQERNIEFIDTTPNSHSGCRGLEIKTWLEEHQDLDIENYIIIDDEMFDIKDYFDESHIVDTDYASGAGLTKEKTEEAIYKLTHKLDNNSTIDSYSSNI